MEVPRSPDQEKVGVRRLKKRLILLAVIFVGLCIVMAGNARITDKHGSKQSAAHDAGQPGENSIPLGFEDYQIEISGTKIDLEARYQDLEIPLEELPLDNHYVGDVVVDGVKYTYYMHKFDGFMIYTSNALFDKKGRKSEDYVIAQITVTGSDIPTHRGVRVGSALDEVLKQYGDGNQVIDENDIYIYYAEEDKGISFVIDKDSRTVKEMVLKLIVSDGTDSM